MKITTQKISKKDALKLYSNLITPNITELKNTKGKSKNKRNNIFNVLENLMVIISITKINHQNQNQKILQKEQN